LGLGQPYDRDTQRRFPQLPEHHQGLDVVYGDPRRPGDPVPSPFAATVKRVGHDPKGYGNYVVLDVGGREVIAGHLQEVKVKPGDKVRPGDLLGLEGQTGAATGPHVHWEIRQGREAGHRPKGVLPPVVRAHAPRIAEAKKRRSGATSRGGRRWWSGWRGWTGFGWRA
jgi:murein DD-endopeptidase MepM/ murein hydrolase activator NlpD